MIENTENKILEKLGQIDQRLDSVDQKLARHDAQFERIASLVLDNTERITRIEAKLDTKVSRDEFLQAQDQISRLLRKHDEEIVAINSRSDDYVMPQVNKIPAIERDVAQLKAHVGIV